MTRANDIDPNGSFERAFAEAAGTVAQERPRPAINRITRDDIEEFCQDWIALHNSLDHYQHIATKSAIYPGKGTPFGLMYAALGLAEAGEVQNKVKKAFRDDGCIEFFTSCHESDGGVDHVKTYATKPITPERRAEIIKELGGVLWYISATCNEIGASLSEVALTNLTELAGRTERGTLQGSGDDR